MYTDPWVTTYIYGDNGSWGLYYNSQVTDDKQDKGISMVAKGNNGVVSRLETPKFTTKDLKNVAMTLELIKTNIPNVRILAEIHGEEPEIIGEISSKDLKQRIEKFTFTLPEKYLDREWAGLIIETEFDDDDQILVIESITINGETSSVSQIDAEDFLKIASGKGLIKVSGLNGREVTVVDINGNIVGRKIKSDEAQFDLDKGIYIVVSGNRRIKAAVK